MTSRAHQLRQAGYSLLRGEREWVERVIERAIADDVSIYHAHWLDSMDRLDEMPVCSICNGRLPGNPNPHSLCAARQRRGLPTPPMDYTPSCGCTPCRIAAGEMQ